LFLNDIQESTPTFMAEIFPFTAYRYDRQRVLLDDVVTQPYDKITPAMQEAYAKASPYNLIAVENGQSGPNDSTEDNVYTRAAKALNDWIRSGILVRDSSSGIYVYSQEYAVPGASERRTRKGFIALGRVVDYSDGVVFRHEQTLAGPKADRLALLRHTRTHTGQLFMLYTDPARRLDALLDEASPLPAPVEVRDEYKVVHRLWPVFGPERIAAIVREMADKQLVIADGHHRYETARAYRDERRAQAGCTDLDAPYEKVMMTLFNTRGSGLLILPTHRVVSNLAGFNAEAFLEKTAVMFEPQTYSFGSDVARGVVYGKFKRDLAALGSEGRAIGMYAGSTFYLLRLRPDADLAQLLPGVSPAQRGLDVVLLHQLLLEKGLGITPAAVSTERNLTYEREMDTAIAAVDEGRPQICFLLNPVDVEQVTNMALAGEVLPQKSTDFYPKLLSGLTLYRLD
jgi:uncharacterized protein (DUF1015 family)